MNRLLNIVEVKSFPLSCATRTLQLAITHVIIVLKQWGEQGGSGKTLARTLNLAPGSSSACVTINNQYIFGHTDNRIVVNYKSISYIVKWVLVNYKPLVIECKASYILASPQSPLEATSHSSVSGNQVKLIRAKVHRVRGTQVVVLLTSLVHPSTEQVPSKLHCLR